MIERKLKLVNAYHKRLVAGVSGKTGITKKVLSQRDSVNTAGDNEGGHFTQPIALTPCLSQTVLSLLGRRLTIAPFSRIE
jgi:hypothetical protein